MIFEEYKEEIKKAVSEKMISFFPIEEDFIMINYFAGIPLHKDTPCIGHGSVNIPIILVIGKTTGLVYSFSLKVLLPNLFI